MSDLKLTIGSLFSGYGGLDLATESVLNARTAWHCEWDDAPSKILAHRWPGVPNHRDVTSVDWSRVEPVDVLTGGYPCQPFSAAGQRKGAADERHLWPYVREAIRHLRPRLAVLENVAGHRSMGFDRVLGDLAEIGFNARWESVRASDIGAPHRRERLFIVATPADAAGISWRIDNGNTGSTQHRSEAADSVKLLPTPRATDGTKGGPNRRGSSGDLTLPSAVCRLLPTPMSSDYKRSDSPADRDRHSPSLAAVSHHFGTTETAPRWGQYELAIRRWENVTRPAPCPTAPNRHNKSRLSPAFVEWLMGLPDGWVTSPGIGLTRTQQLKALGNGVVPQQAQAALSVMLDTNMGVAA